MSPRSNFALTLQHTDTWDIPKMLQRPSPLQTLPKTFPTRRVLSVLPPKYSLPAQRQIADFDAPQMVLFST